ncbi:beta-ketoacyl-[acyl-carrier-protein] synthase family protein [Mariniblastus fucicola]|uniref:3-oxoacyl-[acyl-carrier-protein] synthase 2 n=1 Tax=Mariniblastus fucicola TaxID=980251 RepID=A0A5B9P4C0_9BACT|nr:beta-ketoacyl-[acyl-carrier-protein] synthase family protein [Mariniblastus fucicola]QEG20339.1 3-oxoacyl-[acyl-carrier-protein] synthase 2 [Mariniblastus fucicola]
MSSRRVVITGLGLISPLGNSPESLWNALSSGVSGVDVLQRVPADHLTTDIGGECREFSGDIADFGEVEKKLKRNIKKSLRLMCREIQLGVAAAQFAIADASLGDHHDPSRVGTLFGSDYIITEPAEFASGVANCLNDDHEFDFSTWAENGLTKVEPTWLLKYLPNMPASHIAILNDLQGPSNSLTVREASANLAVAEAMTIIQRGSADAMIVGSTGSRIHPLRTVHVVLQEALADRNAPGIDGDATKACRPFDSHRCGMVLGEGAGSIMLENLDSAQQRGATIWGEVVGYGSSLVAPGGVPDYETAFENVIHGALETAKVTADEIGHVHAHGLSSIAVDQQEATAIRKLLGETPVTAAKSYMGNLGAGGGMVELIASVLAMKNDQLFPILNYDSPDEACPINAVAASTNPGDQFLNLSCTPQGQASSVIVRKFE